MKSLAIISLIVCVFVVFEVNTQGGEKKKCEPVKCTADCDHKEQKALKEKGECYTCKCKCGARSGERCEVDTWCIKTIEGSKSKERVCCPSPKLTDKCVNPTPKKSKKNKENGDAEETPEVGPGDSEVKEGGGEETAVTD